MHHRDHHRSGLGDGWWDGQRDGGFPLFFFGRRLIKDIKYLAGDWRKWRRLLRGSSDNLEIPQAKAEEAQGRPAESEAIYGNQQRCCPKN